jgi:hypothetical protein
MMLPRIRYKNQTLVFVADLLPSSSHIPLPYVMGYDTRPLVTMEEKAQFLQQAANENYLLILNMIHTMNVQRWHIQKKEYESKTKVI